MLKDELKQKACAAIDARRECIIDIAEKIWRHPELAFNEHHTSELIADFWDQLGLKVQRNLAVTGCRTDICGNTDGPTVALLGEMDALTLPEHPDAAPETGAVHACGHHAQCAAIAGAAIGLVLPEISENLAGKIALLAVPAEEHHEEEHYRILLESKKLQYTSGKQQLIHEGVFDDVDIAIMIHSGHDTFAPSSFNGFLLKNITFKGSAAHAGLSPSTGINALSMARLALSALDFQRDTFRDEDTVRIHGIITRGGDAINIVPPEVELALQIRAKTPEAIRHAAAIVDRSLQSAALAFGGEVEIATELGYFPFQSCQELEKVHAANLKLLDPESHFYSYGHRPSSTDMGDVSMIIPSLHAYTNGTSGTPHQLDFLVYDPDKAYIRPAKLLAMNAIELLYGNAESGRRISAVPTRLSRQEYTDSTAGRRSVKSWNYRKDDFK